MTQAQKMQQALGPRPLAVFVSAGIGAPLVHLPLSSRLPLCAGAGTQARWSSHQRSRRVGALVEVVLPKLHCEMDTST